ncbi:MAG: MarR family winged helix-turn-helix transcriptional regulator [Erysipelotrichales bacterium]
MNAQEILNELLVDLFNHILYLEEENLHAKGISLTMNEVHTIEAIRDLDNPIMSSVAKKLMITLGTLTTSVKRLEAKGYVERFRDSIDARNVRVRLTKSAQEVMVIHDKFHEDMINTILNDLDEKEEVVLLSSLMKVQDYFKSTYKQ